MSRRNGLLRGACHRARIRATRWLAMTVSTRATLPVVVPANAGTHNHGRERLRESRRTGPLKTSGATYGSLLSQGRRLPLEKRKRAFADPTELKFAFEICGTKSTSSRTSEPTGRREAPPDDRLHERDPGPITTNFHVVRSYSSNSVHDRRRWLWVPAFAGATVRAPTASSALPPPRRRRRCRRLRASG
jgi:hypothetical protein